MKKRYFIMAVLLCCTLLFTGCGKKTLKCSKDYSSSYGNGMKMTQDVVATFSSNKVEKLTMKMNFELPESYASYASTYFDSLKNQYETSYGKYNGVKVSVDKASDMKFTVTISMDYKKLSSADKTAMGFVGSESYSANKSSFEKEGYTCK